MQTFFTDNNSNALILFLSGWGMDERPFFELKSTKDILLVHNYNELSLDFDFSIYENITLITFSYGVFMADYLQNVLPKCNYKIAVNGTLSPIHDEFGIPERIFSATLEKIDEKNYMKFRKRLFTSDQHFERFNQNEPFRTLEDSQSELEMLKQYTFDTSNQPKIKYDKVLIAKEDKIIPTKNQQNFWQNHSNVKLLDGGHFNFYNFESFDDIIDL